MSTALGPYAWLANEPGPRMLIEALRLYGTTEKAGGGDNPEILAWAREVGLRNYTSDAIPWCFGGRTVVETTDGPVAIEKIGEDSLVIGADGYPHPVGRTLSRVSDALELKALGIPETLTTADHPYLARHRLGRRKVGPPSWVPVNQLHRGDFIALPPPPEAGDGGPDDDVAFLLGIYLAEGTGRSPAPYKHKPQYDRPDTVSLHIGHHEVDEIRSACAKAGVDRVTFTPRRTNCQVEIRDVWFVALCAQFGRVATEKAIPRPVLSWRLSARHALLSGYIAGDGHIVAKRARVDISTISLELAVSVALLARSLGYRPSIRVDHRAGKHVIEDRTVNVRDRYIINWFSWAGAGDSCGKEQFFDDAGFRWTPVRSIVERRAREIVHDLTVEGSSFIANGAVVHNCGLFMAIVAKRAGKPLAKVPLQALSWSAWGTVSRTPSLGDVLVFVRSGGGHVGLYVGEDDIHYHVLGGNQSDAVNIRRIPRSRFVAARRLYSIAPPANVRVVRLTGGDVSESEA